jgi:hypothetical protein
MRFHLDEDIEMSENYKLESSFGLWSVFCSDIGCRITKHLGNYQGCISDIAFYLQYESVYSLHFKPCTGEIPKVLVDKKLRKEGSVHISFDQKTGTWDKSEETMKTIQELLKDEDVEVVESNYFGSFCLLAKEVEPDVEDKEEYVEYILNYTCDDFGAHSGPIKEAYRTKDIGGLFNRYNFLRTSNKYSNFFVDKRIIKEEQLGLDMSFFEEEMERYKKEQEVEKIKQNILKKKKELEEEERKLGELL